MNRLPHLRPTRAALVALLCVCATSVSASPSEAQPGVSEVVLDEPVFHGKALVRTAGPKDAPPVVLVHGLGDKASRDWDGLMPQLARGFRVLTFDLPGFGRSTKDNAPYTPANYAAFVRFVVAKELGARPVRLVGHSLGGAIALRYAALHPQDVTALVLVDVPAVLHRVAYSQYLARVGVDSLPSLYRAQNAQLRNLTANLFGFMERLNPTPEAIVLNPKLRKNFLNADPTWIAGLALALEDFSTDLARVAMPTLLLWGGRDEIAPLRNGRALAAMLPHAQLEVFAASGHTPMDDVPAAFDARVAGFLRAPVIEHASGVLRGPLPAISTSRVASCRRQHDVQFEGDYDRLTIEHCRGVRVQDARIRRLHIADSAVNIEDSVIGGTDGGLVVDDDSRVTVTSSRIEGRVAITVTAARLDLSGVRLVGAEAAVRASRASQLLFSISEVQSPFFNGPVHGLRIVTPDSPL